VIGKISTPRGEHVERLLYYLFGPGRREEHTDPHIVAGWRHPASLEPALRPDGKRDFATLTGLLKQPQAALGERGYPQPVWHCAMRAAPEDRMLSDDEWAVIAYEVMHRTGLSPDGQEDQAVRWIAVRHGNDHIHLVAMLARQDGGKPTLSWERYKVRAACLAAEQRYGLRSTAPADHTAARRPTRAENEKAARRGLDEAPRITLRRQVITAAAAAGSEHEFFARLDHAGPAGNQLRQAGRSPSKRSCAREVTDIGAGHGAKVPVRPVAFVVALTRTTPVKWRPQTTLLGPGSGFWPRGCCFHGRPRKGGRSRAHGHGRRGPADQPVAFGRGKLYRKELANGAAIRAG
jgi:hypothetical protein